MTGVDLSGSRLCPLGIRHGSLTRRFAGHIPPLFIGALLAWALVIGTLASSASASATLGLMFTGSNEATEGSEEWNVLGRSGAGLFRIAISPADSGSGNDWSYYDRVFGRAAENGVTILPILTGRLNGGAGVPPAGETEAWSDWAKKAVRRYGYNGTFWASNPGIPARPAIAWEMWNEPNNGGFSSVTATEYGTFLAWAGVAVQAASESWGGQKTGVLFGGLLSWSGATNYQTYLKNAYNVPGASSAFTGLAFHPYTVAVADNNQKIAITKSAIMGARAFLNTLAGGAGKSLWVTEFGWPTQGEFAVTEGAQANMLKQTVGWMKAEASSLNLHSIIWYNYRDSDFSSGWQYRCGLRDEVGNFREAWFAFQEEAGVTRWPVPRVAIQANTGTTFTYSKAGGGVNTLLGTNPGTSPSIAQYKGTYEVALQANTGTLWTWTPSAGGSNTNLGMAPGTSPSITPLEAGHIAFQGNTGTLWTYDQGSGGVNTGLKMAGGTSPAITVLPGLYWRRPARYAIAFQGSNGNLTFSDGKGGVVDTGLGMAPGTSPAIAAQDGGASEFAIAFQANTGQMWLYEPGGTVASTGLGMQPKTSPAIASLPSGRYTISFQANTGQMWLYNPGGTVASTGLGMQPESSPSVIGLGDLPYHQPYEIAFNVNTGAMWTYEPGGAVVNTLLGSNPATSTSIAPG